VDAAAILIPTRVNFQCPKTAPLLVTKALPRLPTAEVAYNAFASLAWQYLPTDAANSILDFEATSIPPYASPSTSELVGNQNRPETEHGHDCDLQR
jgi:UDP-N-acetylglucosamine:LPS N-acetylglucosamine transferase